MNARNKNFLIGLIVVVVAIIVTNMLTSRRTATQELIYSDFLNRAQLGQVSNIVLSGNRIEGQLADGSTFTSYAPKDPALIATLQRYKVKITARPDAGSPWYVTILVHWGPFLLIIAIWIFLMRRMQGTGSRLFSLGKSRARLADEKAKKTTFADVAGVEEAKADLVEIIEFLKNPAKFRKLGGKIPKGVLMVGPPGTGKTLLAKAVAGEAAVPFFSISGSDFVEMFVGVGASRVRDLFEEGRKNAPCILFIDEIDAVGRHRGAGLGSGHDEREQTLNQLLVELDGFDSSEGVIVIAATNRVDVLDPALLRPGRFDRQVTIPLPDLRGREQILRIHSAKVQMAPAADLGVLARGTPGFSGADLRNLINEAALYAARKNKQVVELADLEWARDKVLMGPERRAILMTEVERRITAYHAAGHALVGALMAKADPVHKITIVPRGRSLGLTSFLPKEDIHTYDREYLLARIVVAMGGRAAEELVFGEITTGAGNDILQATQTARNMVTQWGMSEAIGPVQLGAPDHQAFLGREIGIERDYGEDTAELIDREVHTLVESAYQKAKALLTQHSDKLHHLAKRLLESETVEGDELRAILVTA
ncbi:MAG: ATP-dependent metallopeptidase FtsH/Yme1/Tma family protein [Candidatus Lambdaproteobacteria bacterium]|nr:ATP-dependent metallopeptidase FtsH/Yme1/Tma family protein [Candidatus Lambdaproteobacteria bacterium]